MFYTENNSLRRDLSEEEFNQWKESWLREKGCPFFACSQALYRKVCGSTFICGALFDYTMYKEKQWIKICDVKLSESEDKLPTHSCSACTGSMCLKFDDEHELLVGKSFCKHMNDLYESKKIVVDRSIEKYQATWGAFIIPILGEDAFLTIQDNPKIMEEIQKELDAKKL